MGAYTRVLALGLLTTAFVTLYFDVKVPEPIPEKWKIRMLDALMKTSLHLTRLLIGLGIMEPFSETHRNLVERITLFQITGSPWPLPDDPQLKVRDDTFDGVPVRVYEPDRTLDDTSRPVVIFFHGGGWCMLSVDTHDPLTRKIAKDTGFVVISVNYRLSPQFKYPAPFEDCLNVVEYVLAKGESLGIDPKRLAVAGDSSGGNLAAAVSLRLKSRIKLQLLLVPPLQMLDFNTSSVFENLNYFSKTLNRKSKLIVWFLYGGIDPVYLQQFMENNHTSVKLKKSKYYTYVDFEKLVPKYYIRTISIRDRRRITDYGNTEVWEVLKSKLLDPYLSPLVADNEMLKDLPEAYVMTANYDVIRDDGIMYSQRLKAAGTKIIIRNFPDAFHNVLWFHSGPFRLSVASRIVKDITNFLKARL